MPPRFRSRYMFCFGLVDDDGRTFLNDRVPFRFRNLPDNVQHTVKDGDTLHGLAALYFSPIERAALLWWIIADYQPKPVHDPTVKLEPGSTIFVPSVRTVEEEIFAASRKDETRP